MGIEVSGIFGLAVLVAVLWALVHIAQSAARPVAKAVWMALVLVLPVLGFIVWLAAGPRARRAP